MAFPPAPAAQQQAALLDATRTLQALLAGTRDSVIVTDASGAIVSWNAGAKALWGYEAEEMIGRTPALLYQEQARSEFERNLTGIAEGAPYEGEWKGTRKDGSEIWCDVTTTAVRGDDGQLIGFVGIARDTSHRHRYEERLRGQLEGNDQLIAFVSHDLRSPLQTVMLSAGLLARDMTGADERRRLDRILSGAKRAESLVATLLDFAHARLAGGIPLQGKPADLSAIARQAVEECGEGRVRLVEDGGADFRGEWDPRRIHQVLANLLTNARRHGDPSAPIVLTLRADEVSLEASVQNGGAIPSEVQGRIFEPFVHGGRDPESVGLGLFIARTVAEGHGGSLSVHSSHEDGTTFTLRLPRKANVAVAASPANPRCYADERWSPSSRR